MEDKLIVFKKMQNIKFDLKKKYSLITGAGGLLGYEHAAALIECNSNVVLTDISEDTLEITKRRLLNNFKDAKILCYKMDVTDIKSIKEVSDNLLKKDLKIEILINNAAIDPKVKQEKNKINNSTKFENFSLKQWELEIGVGLTGAFQCSQIFGYEMAKNKKGVTLNIASDLSVIAPDQRIYKNNLESDQFYKPITYSVIKTGLIGLTKYIATYWAEDGVRCNAISPGGVFNNQNPEFIKRLSQLIPLGRMANKDEYRGAIQFLCSDASSYMTGFNLVMDGGRHIW